MVFVRSAPMVKLCGNFNNKQVLPCGPMSGASGTHLDDIFTSSALGDMNTRYKNR